VLISLASTLILSYLDFGNATLAGSPSYVLDRLQSVMNSSARLVFTLSMYDHTSPLLHQLQWLKAAERIDYKLVVGVIATNLSVAPSFHREVIVDFSMRPASLLRVCACGRLSD